MTEEEREGSTASGDIGATAAREPEERDPERSGRPDVRARAEKLAHGGGLDAGDVAEDVAQGVDPGRDGS